MSNEIVQWDSEKIALLKRTIAKDSTDDELALFVQVCKRTQLDPFNRQIYAIKRWTKEGPVMTIQTGIDGFRVVAQRSQEYGGQVGPQWCGADGEWKDVWLSSDHPLAARVGVMRKGETEPMLWSTALWAEFCPLKKDGKPMAMWQSMPALMLGKVAEAQALRRAFPAELSGVYGDEEMQKHRPMDDAVQLAPVDERLTLIQKTEIGSLVAQCELSKEQALTIAIETIGREVVSAAELTADEADLVIEELRAHLPAELSEPIDAEVVEPTDA